MNAPRGLDPKLQAMLHDLANAEATSVDVQGELRDQKNAALRDAYHRMQGTDPSRLRPGDLVRWQSGLKNAKWPHYGEVAVVVECLDPPLIIGPESVGSPYFREPQSLVLGLRHEGTFRCWHYDGRRFERVAQ